MVAVITISHHSPVDSLCLCWLYESLQGQVPKVPRELVQPHRQCSHKQGQSSCFTKSPRDNPERLAQEPLSQVKRLKLAD